MKYEDLKDLKSGDKVIVRVAEIDKRNNYWTVRLVGMGTDGWIENEAVIAVYHEPAKIKMTVEEKKEFDKLLKNINNSNSDFADILNVIWNNDGDYHNLRRRLFVNASLIVDRKKQFEFARALENPELVEVEKSKKYYVRLFTGERGYLNKDLEDNHYILGGKDQNSYYQTQFTKDEIAKIPQDAFKITDKALEEVEKDEDDI
jgi:hypothetical protein